LMRTSEVPQVEMKPMPATALKPSLLRTAKRGICERLVRTAGVGSPTTISALAVALLCAVGAMGCTALVAPVVVGAGSTAAETYWRGEHEGYVDAPFWQCEQAVQEVARRFNLETVQCRSAGTTRIFQLRNVEDTPFWIRIEPLSEDCTRGGIRAGVWGDDVCSAKILAEIRQCTPAERRQ